MGEPTGPADEGAEAGQDLLDPERLRHVVVGAGVDALNLFVPGAARGKDQDRSGDAGLAPAAKQGQAVDLRQPEVEDGAVVIARVDQPVRLFAVEGAVGGIAGFGEGGGDPL